MINIHDVVTIAFRRERVFYIVFDDGLAGEIDFSEYLSRGPVFAPLTDNVFFEAATVEGGTIAWPNGADIAPETLYRKLQTTAIR